jgi:HSP20 family protein
MTHMRINRFPIQNVIDGLLNEAFHQVITPAVRGVVKPATNIHEDEHHFLVELVAPGYTKEDLTISLNKGILQVSAKKEVEKPTEAVNKMHLREFILQTFDRSFTLPENVDGSNISAIFENGILFISLPKVAEVEIKPQTIKIA